MYTARTSWHLMVNNLCKNELHHVYIHQMKIKIDNINLHKVYLAKRHLLFQISDLLQSKHSGCWSNILEKEARPCVLGGRRVVFQDEHLRKVLCYQVGKYFLTQKIYCHRFYCCCSIILPPSKKGSSRTVIGINVCSFGKCIFLGKLSYLAGAGYRFHWNILKTAYSTAALINFNCFLVHLKN